MCDSCSVQLVFELLDALRHRRFAALKLSNVPKPVDMPELRVSPQRLGEILDAIPTLTMAEAAQNCRAHTRALLHFETHIREQNKLVLRYNPSGSLPAADG